MRISQLSQRAGLPVGTVKFYLRTGLLHHGRATSATQAIYDESHLARLRLVRALLETGKLSHAEIQRVLDAVSQPVDEALGTVERLGVAVATPSDENGDLDIRPARALTDEVGWQVSDDSPHLADLARALAALDSIGVTPSRDRLKVYAEAASHVARNDVQTVCDADEEDRALVAAAGTVLHDSLLVALRRLAVDNQVARFKGRVPSPRVAVPSA
jgi:DNA-binding transcriptional MerR regulator